jgi:hypothetical protein
MNERSVRYHVPANYDSIANVSTDPAATPNLYVFIDSSRKKYSRGAVNDGTRSNMCAILDNDAGAEVAAGIYQDIRPNLNPFSEHDRRK